MNDSVSNFINKLKVASVAKKSSFQFPYSRFIENIAQVLLKRGFLAGISKKGKNNFFIECQIAFDNKEPKIRSARRISRPSKRVYMPAREIRSVRQGFGIAILSTPKGVISDIDARKARVGGEVLCEVW